MSYNRLLQSVQVATENLKKIPEEIKKIVEYCLKDEDNAWSKDTVELLVCYHIFKKTIITIYNDNHDIICVFMWYNCNTTDGLDFIKNWEEDKKDGDAIMLGFLKADNMNIVKAGILELIKIEPNVLHKQLTAIRKKGKEPKLIKYKNNFLHKLYKS
jgi:hypothetical protein